MKVIVASRNPAKLRAVEDAFARQFPDETIAFVPRTVDSGVSVQPMSDEETRRGARSRAGNARGVEPDADFWIGLEGGIETIDEQLMAFAWMAVLESPNGTIATVLTFIPTATPLILLLRVAAPPGPPAWEVVGGLLVCAVATVACVAASGKIFRIGVLSQGQTPSFKNLVGWIFTK